MTIPPEIAKPLKVFLHNNWPFFGIVALTIILTYVLVIFFGY